MNFSTKLVAFDAAPGDPFGPTCTPIYQTATFEQESALEFGRFDYSRSGNPTREVLERLLADLEGGTRAFAFASGLAAITAVTRLLQPGDEILACDDLYGGAYRLFTKLLEPRGIKVRYADFTRPEALVFTPLTKLVYVESPSNPLLRIANLRNLASLAHSHGAFLCVDGTATTPYLQRPLELGADIVLHSATKYLSGHADLTAGTVCVKDRDLAEKLYFIQNGEGAALAPFDSYLLLRGLKTLSLRLDRQQATAQTIAEWLVSLGSRSPERERAGLPSSPSQREGLGVGSFSSSPSSPITAVHFPGLPSHPGFALHRQQALGPGAVLSFETGDVELSRRIVEGLRLFRTAVSFGGVGSSASLPCRMSHAPIAKDGGATHDNSRTLPPDLVRLSIGIEDPRDLLADLKPAIENAAKEPIAPAIEVPVSSSSPSYLTI